MTPLKKAVQRLSTDTLTRFSRPLVVILGPGSLIGFREHGRRKVYTTTIGACAALALRQTIAAERAAKLAARKARKA
jgi:hypothetical protein